MSDDWTAAFWAFVAILATWVGDLAKALHEEVHGGRAVNARHVLRRVPAVLAISLTAVVAGQYLHDTYGLHNAVGGAAGGLIGYIGLDYVSMKLQALIERWKPVGKDKAGD